jgi:hypothetical protein
MYVAVRSQVAVDGVRFGTDVKEDRSVFGKPLVTYIDDHLAAALTLQLPL